MMHIAQNFPGNEIARFDRIGVAGVIVCRRVNDIVAYYIEGPHPSGRGTVFLLMNYSTPEYFEIWRNWVQNRNTPNPPSNPSSQRMIRRIVQWYNLPMWVRPQN